MTQEDFKRKIDNSEKRKTWLKNGSEQLAQSKQISQVSINTPLLKHLTETNTE